MQFPEMRALYTPKHIINLSLIHKSLSHPSFISVQSLRNPTFLPYNHRNYHRHGHGEPSPTWAERRQSSGWDPNARRVFTEYDPMTGRVVARRGQSQINCKSHESGSDSGDDGVRTYMDDGDRTYGNVRKGKSGGGSEGRPNFDRRSEGFAAGERGFGGVQKGSSVNGSEGRPNFDRRGDGFAAGERDFGGVQKGSSVNGLDRRFGAEYSVKNSKKKKKKGKSQSFWVCSNCGHREGQKWESCRACKSTGTMSQASGNGNGNGGSGNKRNEFGDSGNKFNSYGRDKSYESTEKANVIGGSGSYFQKRVNKLYSDSVLENAKESFGQELSTEEVMGNKESVNDKEELQVLDNSVFPLQPVTMKHVTSVDDFVGGRTSESVQTGEIVSMKQDLQSNSEDYAPIGLSRVGDRVSDSGRDELSESVKRENRVEGWVNQLNYIKGVEDISGESDAVVVESEAETDNKASVFEVSGNAMHSCHPKQVSDAHPSLLTVKQELESSSQNETQMGLSSSSNEINGLDSVKKPKSVHGSVNSSGFDKGGKDFSRERASTHVFGHGYNVGDIVTKKKKGKSAWVCSNCGHTEGQWWGSCKGCNCVGTMKRFSVGDYGGDETSGFEGSENAGRSWLPKRADKVLPMRLTDVNRGINKQEWRIPLPGSFGSEVARVLGGGLVPGSLVLIGGDPGIGKSTLLLQIAAMIAEGHDIREPGPVVYVSGEESVEQIGNRADRMEIATEELFLYSGTDIEDILGKTNILSPRLLIVDSIQAVYMKDVTGSAGGLSQVKECTSALLRYAKKTNVPVLLIGHVTKTGDIAGPRVLEHIVDVVLYLEGEKCTSHRLLRSIKNRFGSTDELGVFQMSQLGLSPVTNPSEMYLSEQQPDSEYLAGLAVAVTMDGTRSFLIEIQALWVSSSRASRHFNGVQDSRADMIISVLTKQAGLMLQEGGIFLNVISGVTLRETAGDLAIAAAICSSFLGVPIPTGVAFIGEIGLSGELRGVPRMDVRVNTVAQLGYKKCIVPKSAVKSLKGQDHKGMEVIGFTNLKDVINTVFP